MIAQQWDVLNATELHTLKQFMLRYANVASVRKEPVPIPHRALFPESHAHSCRDTRRISSAVGDTARSLMMKSVTDITGSCQVEKGVKTVAGQERAQGRPSTEEPGC